MVAVLGQRRLDTSGHGHHWQHSVRVNQKKIKVLWVSGWWRQDEALVCIGLIPHCGWLLSSPALGPARAVSHRPASTSHLREPLHSPGPTALNDKCFPVWREQSQHPQSGAGGFAAMYGYSVVTDKERSHSDAGTLPCRPAPHCLELMCCAAAWALRGVWWQWWLVSIHRPDPSICWAICLTIDVYSIWSIFQKWVITVYHSEFCVPRSNVPCAFQISIPTQQFPECWMCCSVPGGLSWQIGFGVY